MTAQSPTEARALTKSTNVRTKKEKTNVRLPLPFRLAGRFAGVFGSAASARFLMTLFTLPRRHRRPAREETVLRRAVPFRLKLSSGARLWAWSWGAGPVVALVHGWEGRGSQLSSFVGPLVARGYRVVTFDAPAHGDSAGVRTDVRDFADALLALARREAGLHAVVAHSMGGLATGLAVQRGLELERVVLVAPNPSPARPLAWLGAELGVDDEAMARVQREISSYADIAWDDLARGGMYEQLTMPTFVVHDRDDTICHIDATRELVARTGARFFETGGLGHNRVLRDERVVDEALAFLAEGRTDRARGDGWQRFLSDFDAGFEMPAWA